MQRCAFQSDRTKESDEHAEIRECGALNISNKLIAIINTKCVYSIDSFNTVRVSSNK